MKTSLKTACLLMTFVAATLSANLANAQQFQWGPVTVRVNSIGRTDHYPSVFPRPYPNRPGRPRIAEPQPERHNPWENPIYVEPKQVERMVYDPATGTWKVKVTQEVINESATDPYRDVVDPGSFHVTTDYRYDRFGNRIRIVTEHWTSYGVPHFKRTQRTIQNRGNVEMDEELTVLGGSAP